MKQHLLFPIAFKNSLADEDSGVVVLAGDIGGTKTNIALCRISENGVEKLREARYVSKDFRSLTQIIEDFSAEEKPRHICMAVAGPVLDGKVKFTNLPWELDSDVIESDLGIPVSFINDLESTAYGLAALKEDELVTLYKGDKDSHGNMAILAPGTGLGEAGLYFDGLNYFPFATEGGHCDFAPRSEEDIEVYRFLHLRHEHVSWERVLSGTGIYTLWQFLVEAKGRIPQSWVTEKMKNTDPPAVISQAALENKCPVCIGAMELFKKYLAYESAQLVLKTKATGGLIIAGGIPPKILPLLQGGEPWSEFFIHRNGRMDAMMRQVKVQVVMNEKLPLLGAAYYAAFNG
jgi:glucokinase